MGKIGITDIGIINVQPVIYNFTEYVDIKSKPVYIQSSLNVSQPDLEAPDMKVVVIGVDKIYHPVNNMVIHGDYGYILTIKDKLVIYTSVEIINYTLNRDRLTVYFSSKTNISIAVVRDGIRKIVVDEEIICGNVSMCEELRDQDNVIVVDP